MEEPNRRLGSRDRLKAALEAAGIGSLVPNELLNDAEINLQSLINQIQRMGVQSQTGLQTSPRGMEEPNRREPLKLV